MHFPNCRPPAASPRASKAAVRSGLEMKIVHHELPDNFHLLSLVRVDSVKRPIRVPRVPRIRRHLRDDALLLQLREQRASHFGMLCPRLPSKVGIESHADVIIKVSGVCASAVASLTLDRMCRTPLARILREIKVRDYRIDVSLAQAGELIGKRSMV